MELIIFLIKIHFLLNHFINLLINLLISFQNILSLIFQFPYQINPFFLKFFIIIHLYFFFLHLLSNIFFYLIFHLFLLFSLINNPFLYFLINHIFYLLLHNSLQDAKKHYFTHPNPFPILLQISQFIFFLILYISSNLFHPIKIFFYLFLILFYLYYIIFHNVQLMYLPFFIH